jgi:hypothetical protein
MKVFLSKLKNFAKKNFLGFILGLLFCGGIAFVNADYRFTSTKVYYDSTLSSKPANVGAALDDLYSKASYGNAAASQILKDKTALVGGKQVTGTMTNYGDKTITPANDKSGNSATYNGYVGKVTVNLDNLYSKAQYDAHYTNAIKNATASRPEIMTLPPSGFAATSYTNYGFYKYTKSLEKNTLYDCMDDYTFSDNGFLVIAISATHDNASSDSDYSHPYLETGSGTTAVKISEYERCGWYSTHEDVCSKIYIFKGVAGSVIKSTQCKVTDHVARLSGDAIFITSG